MPIAPRRAEPATCSSTTCSPRSGSSCRRRKDQPMSHDLVIKGATIVDGTGAEPYSGDVAVDGDRIAAVGRVDGRAARTIDAAGATVTPGFVDVHAHYDGQATWDDLLTPS